MNCRGGYAYNSPLARALRARRLRPERKHRKVCAICETPRAAGSVSLCEKHLAENLDVAQSEARGTEEQEGLCPVWRATPLRSRHGTHGRHSRSLHRHAYLPEDHSCSNLTGDVGTSPVAWLHRPAWHEGSARCAECAHLFDGFHSACARGASLADTGAIGRLPATTKPQPHTWTVRALLEALTAWITTGTEPPPSARPTIAAGNLVKQRFLPPDDAATLIKQAEDNGIRRGP
jgi:hypothetical protein